MDLTQNKYSIFISFLLTLLYFLLIQLISGFVFYLNDDRTLQFILSGHTTAPSFYTLFLSWHIAMPLAGLYSIFPSFPFYGCCMLLSIFVSLWYLVYYIIKKQKNILFSLIFIILLFICIYRIVCRPTFTLAAAFAIIPIMLLILELNFSDKNNLTKNIILLSIFCLLSIGFRHTVFLLALPFIALIIILKAIKAEKKVLLIFPVLVFCYAFSYIGNAVLQKNEEYQNAIEYSTVRSEIFDHYGMPDYYNNVELYESLGISVEAYEMILDYCFDIPEASIENLKAIRDYQKENYNINLNDVFYQICESYLNNAEFLFYVCLMLVLSFIFSLKKHPRELLLVIGFFLGTVFVSFILTVCIKFPTRIASTLLLFNLALGVYIISSLVHCLKEPKSIKYRVLQTASFCLTIAVFCFAYLPNSDVYDNSWKAQITNNYRLLEQYVSNDNDCVYYMSSTANIHYADVPLKESQKALNCLICDWNYLLPSYNMFFKKYDSKNLMDYIGQGKKLKFVILQEDNITKFSFYKYMTKKYDKTFTKIEDYNTFQIYEIT